MPNVVSVKLRGGPRGGDSIKYLTPLPKILVIPCKKDNKTVYVDYHREGLTKEYRYG